MPTRSVLPNTGVWVVRGGQWVVSTDPQMGVDGVWSEAYEVDVQSGGTWKTAFLRPIPVTIAFTSAPLPDLVAGIDNFSGTITGTVTDALGRPVQATLRVTRYWDDTAFERVGDVTSDASGAWSFSFDQGPATVDDIGSYQYYFAFDEDLPFTAATAAAPSFRVNSASVTLRITSQPSGNKEKNYDTITVSGTARREDGSVAPGTVALYMPDDTQTGLQRRWVTVSVDGSGNWTTGAQGPSGIFGRRRITVHYEPLSGGFEDPTTVYGNTLTFVPRRPSFSKGSVGETSIAMSCSDVKATGYQFYEGGTRRYSGSSRSYTRSGLSNYRTYYNWKVRSYGTSPGGSTYYSSFSSEHDARTGRPKITDSGTSGWIDTFSVASGSWRTASNNVWGQRGDKILQGAYSGYQSYGYYRGLIDYGHQGVYNKVHSALGGGSRATNRINNGSVVNGTAEVFLWKNCGVGTNGAITLRWYRTNTAAGNNPSAIGSAYDVGTTACGAGNWLDIGNTHGTYIVKSKNRGLCVIYDSTSSSRYGEFNGRSAGHWDCVLHLKWTWSYTSQTKVNGTWLN